jgi:hypothetical protein
MLQVELVETLYTDIALEKKLLGERAHKAIKEIESQVGPRYCNNCIHYGFHNGVFIGYCANCASTSEYKRGNGMFDFGLEMTNIYPYENDKIKDENSMWNVYMQCTDLNEIGDVELAKEHARNILYRTMDDSASDLESDYSEKIDTNFDSISFQCSSLPQEMGTDISMNDFDIMKYWENYWKMKEDDDEMDLGESVFVSVSSTSPLPSSRPNSPENA